MTHSLDTKRQQTYNSIVEAYHTYRPGYPAEIISFLQNKYGLNAHSRVLEIGCGTGKFTQSLQAVGCRVDALDISENMIAFVRGRYGSEKIVFHHTSFEDYVAETGAYDFILAATAFHWVSPAARDEKVAQLLKPGGVLAFCYHNYPKDALRAEISAVYDAVLGIDEDNVPMVEDATDRIYRDLQHSGAFTNAETQTFIMPIEYTTETYIGKMRTHSFQNTLPEEKRAALFAGMRAVIERHGGVVTLPYEVRLFCLQT